MTPQSILNTPPTILGGPDCLHKLIRWNEHDKSSTALDFLGADGQRWKYGYAQLRNQITSLARIVEQKIGAADHGDDKTKSGTKAKATGKQSIVPVLLPQSPALYISILAILEAGAAFCPINLDSPPERIKFVMRDIHARVIITTPEYKAMATWRGGPEVFVIDEYPSTAIFGNLDSFQPKVQPKSSDLAYIMYTSGSSGTPKGVALSHRAAAQSLIAHDPHLPTFKRFLQFAAPSFDVSVFEIFFPLFRGATLVGCSRTKLLNDLTGIINELDVDAAELTPTVVSSLVQSRDNVPGLRLLLTIGEMLTRPVVDEFGSSEDRDGILYGMYGPTETAIHCTINPQMRAGDKVGNIGIPLSTVSTIICASTESTASPSELKVLPIGEVGELVLAGPQLADGYLNRPEQNAAAFITLNGSPAYRTGDKARQLTDGTLEVLGRISAGQVKLRGQRVELGEVEEAVYKHIGIKTAVASIINGVLVVFALTKADGITETEVLSSCSEWLPKFMIPGEIVFLNSFPYLPSGKVDKRALEKEYTEKQESENVLTPVGRGRTDMEKIVGEVLKEVLGVDTSWNSRLASVGVDSLMAIRLASALRFKGFDLSPVQVLQADTPTSLSTTCNSAMRSSDRPNISEITDFEGLRRKICDSSHLPFAAHDIEYVLPCTALQDAMLSETAMNNSAYNNLVELEFHRDFDSGRIREGIQVLSKQNALLRTAFMECQSTHSTYTQVVLNMLPPSQITTVEGLSNAAVPPQNLAISHPFHVRIHQMDNHWNAAIHMHHALYDAWSLELMLDDLEAILNHTQPTSRPSFHILVDEELKSAISSKTHQSIEYWQDQLARFDPSPIPNFHTIHGSQRGLEVLHLETSVPTASLERTARSLCVSSQCIFQAAFALLLSSYCGTPDVCFGTVFSGRTSSIPDIEHIVGPCLSTLPVRLNIVPSINMGELAQLINTTNRKHLDHASLPLREIKKAGGIDPGRSIFDSLLVWQQTLHRYDHQREHVKVVNSTDYLEFNLTLEITPTTENVHLKANYQKLILPKEQVRLLLHQIEQLVLASIQNPSRPCASALSELKSSLQSIENINPINTVGGPLSFSVESIAQRNPDRIAIEFAHSIDQFETDIESVTYFDLNSRANRIANYLILCGVLPDELVCIFMEKSTDLYISILSTVKAGAGYLPLTPDTPTERLLYIVKEANVKVIITHSSLSEKLKDVPSVGLVFVDKADFTTLSASNPPLRAKPSDLAYCIFTSGSTGTPKGVLITRGNLMSNLLVLSELYPHSTTSKLLQSCSQAFDVSVFEIFFTWHIGGTLCSATKDVLFRDMELGINKFGITHLSLTPTVASLLNPSNIPAVEFLVTAGEAITEKVFNTWADRGLWQGYGPSETTNICTVCPRVIPRNAINNIGPPFTNTSVFVLEPGTNDDFDLVPRGAVGEFCFGGEQVGRGYLDRRQEESSFFKHKKHGRLYRSGDFGRLLPDGSLVFTGRKDDQVKIRGQRVELGEINAVMLKQETVRDCVAMVIKDDKTDETTLVGFWTGSQEVTADCRTLQPDLEITGTLFSALADVVPAYMIPSALVPVSCLPSTSQGKIDKRLLSKLYRSLDTEFLSRVSAAQPSTTNNGSAWTETQRNIAKIVTEISRVDLKDIIQDTSFFSLGIDSISAISLSRRLREELSLQVEISDVLKYPSVRRLAEKIRSKEGRSVQNLPRTIASDNEGFAVNLDSPFMTAKKDEFASHGHHITQVWPCTPLQEAMLSATETSLNASTYRNHVVISLKISVQKFQTAWKSMVSRHEILRTCFIRTPDPKAPYVQAVLEGYEDKFIIENGRKSVAEIKSGLDEKAHNVIEWQPPYSLTVIGQVPSTKLLISMHHALYDGFAMAILFEDIEMFLKGEELQHPVCFESFLQLTQQVDTSKADEYWKGILEGFLPRPFTLSRNNHEVGSFSFEKERQITRLTRFTSSSSLKRIGDAIRHNSTTLLSVCQAAWTVLLSKYLVKGDICFGNIVSGRTVPVEGIDRLIAPCFNTIPIRVKDVHKLSYLELFRNLQAQNISSVPFQFSPLRRIQSHHGLGRLFDTLIILQPPAQKLDPSIWALEDDTGAMDLPVVIEIVPQPEKDNLQLILHIHASVLQAYDPAEMLEEYDSILNRALSNPRHFVMSTFARAAVEKNAIASVEASMKSEDDNDLHIVEQMNLDEEEIRDVIAEFSNTPMEKIRKGMSIYRLGLDSINAVQIASALRMKGKNIMANDVLEHPSIEQLAAYISKQQDQGNITRDVGVRAINFDEFDKKLRQDVCATVKAATTEIDAIRPCTPVQAGMLAQTLHSSENGKPDLEYINSLCMELEVGTDISRMVQAWRNVMNEVVMLRTGFAAVEPSDSFTDYIEKAAFVMVIYKEDVRDLPLIGVDEDAAGNVLDSLSTSPWNLQIIDEGNNTSIKFTAHHALYDARSLQLILSEVARQYSSNESMIRKPQSVDSLLSAILTTAYENEPEREAFWKDEKNKINTLKFPDLTPLRESSTRSFVSETTSSLSMQDLDSMCRELNVSVQVASQLAWARLIAAYTGESCVTFGITLSGRSILDGSENIPFPSIVTLPVSCSISGSITELLERTMNINTQLHKHQFTPLTLIQNWAGDGNGGKMFDSLFAYQKTTPLDERCSVPWKIVNEQATADYAASMELQPMVNGSLLLRFTGREDLVPREQADLLLRQYDELLWDTLKHGNRECISAPQANTDLVSVSPAARDILPGSVRLLHEFVELQAKKMPTKIALEFTTNIEPKFADTKGWTYEELNAHGNQIANFLLPHTGRAGSLIAICFDKCPEASFAILGIMKAGFAYVALDPNAPPDRMKFIMADSRSRLILTAGKPAEMLRKIFEGEVQVEVFNLDDKELLRSVSTAVPILRRKTQQDDTCYCLYTSGTTGMPKGCEITHFNAVQAMLSFQHLFAGHWTTDSKWLQFASFHFDVSVLEQFWSWSVGICVASAPRDLIFEDIPGAIRSLGVTHIDLTPSLARLLNPDDVPGLTRGVFITGGEQLKQEILDVWGEKGCVYNGYGPTEATIGVTMYARVPAKGKPNNIGTQFLNVGSFVMRPGTEEPVLRGGVGELCISGALVGKGYLNRPDLTKDRFPNLEQFGEKVYRTGDLVRILYNGDFLFLGRADDQVKLRGQRLELTEINEVVKKNVQSVEEVATLVLKHSLQQKEQLVTFFVLSSSDRNARGVVSSIREACKTHLPGYMVPTHIIAIDKIPLSANNKADAKQLALKFKGLSVENLQKLSSMGQGTNSWTEKEKNLLQIFASYLEIDIERVTKAGNIFELGVDSISVISLSRRLQKEGYHDAKLNTIMRIPSISPLVKLLASSPISSSPPKASNLGATQRIAAFSHKHIFAAATELRISPSAVEAVAPCTPVQEGVIYEFLNSPKPSYFNQFVFILAEDVDLGRLKNAWKKVVASVQILRTKFLLTRDGTAQVVLRSEESTLKWKSVSVPETEVEAQIKSGLNTIADMEKAAALQHPWHLSIIKCDDGYNRMMALTIFHALYDGISLPLLLGKVAAEYIGKHEVKYGPSFHATLPHGPLVDINLVAAEVFFKRYLEGWEPHRLPQVDDTNGVPEKAISVSSILEQIDFGPTRQNLGVTDQAILQAAWTSALCSLTHCSSVTFGVVVSGRSIDFPDAESVIGPLLNTIPFNIRLDKGLSWGQLVKKCQENSVAILPWQNVGLKDVQRWVGGGKELFDSLFVFQRERPSTEEYLWQEILGEEVADFPLAFEAQLNDSGNIKLTIVAKEDLVAESVAKELLESVQTALHALLVPENTVPYYVTVTEVTQDVSKRGLPDDKLRVDKTMGKNNFKWTPDAVTIRSEIEQLAGISSISAAISIFELGLDSIDIIKLASRLKSHGIHLPVSTIVKNQTIAKMAALIAPKSSERIKEIAIKSIEEYEKILTNQLVNEGKLPSGAISVLPATPLQEGMAAEMFASNYTRYFNHELYRVGAGVDLDKLKQAWDIVIAANDILRTHFVELDDVDLPFSFAQVICLQLKSTWRAVKSGEEENIKDVVKALIHEAIEIARSRAHLMQLVDITVGKEHYFLVSIAHGLYDGWLLQALHQDVWEVYHGSLVRRRPNPRQSLESVLNSETPAAASFWQTALTGLWPSEFPRRHGSHANLVHRLERQSQVPLTDIRAFSRSAGTSLQTLGQTAWAMLLATYLQRLDIVFGVVLSCRDDEESNELMFPLMNTVAVRAVLHGSMLEFLRYMQGNSNATREYQHFPLRKAKALAGIEGSLFDTLFIYQGHKGQKSQSSDKKRTLYEAVESVSEVEFAVCVEMEVVDEVLVFRTACKDVALNRRQAEELLRSMDEVIAYLVKSAGSATIIATSKGISVAGLPRFQNEDIKIKTVGETRTYPTDQEDLTATWTDIEKVIRKVLSDVSKIPEGGINKDQNIYHLGLDSISAIKVSSILRREGVRLGVNVMANSNTIRRLAELVDKRDSVIERPNHDADTILLEALDDVDCDTIVRNVHTRPENIENIFPISAGQLYMLSRWQLSRGTQFLGRFRFLAPEDLDREKLQEAWRLLVEHHPILRTIFATTEKPEHPFVQIVLKEVEMSFVRSSSSMAAIRSQRLTTPVSLGVHTDGNDSVLTLQIHHALYDGISLPLLLEDLSKFYAVPRQISNSTISQGFRAFLARSIDIAAVSRKKFWTEYLKGCTSSPHISKSILSNCRIEAFSPDVPVGNLKATAQRLGISIDALLLTTFAKVYSRHIHHQNSKPTEFVVFGLYLANRSPDGEDMSGLAAPTLNLLPLRVNIELRISESAARVQADLREISGAGAVATSLKEISDWTGLQVNCFVNIVKNADESVPSEGLLSRGPAEGAYLRRERAEVVEVEPNAEVKVTLNEIVSRAYLPAVDIELRVTEGGTGLDIGVFAPVELLELERARDLAEKMGELLRGLA